MSRPHHSDDDNDDGWDRETGSVMDSNPRHPCPTASTNPNAPKTAAALERERRGQSYYLPASTAGSLAPNHGRYQPLNSKQHRTVNASIFGAYLRATATLHMTVVVFYPFDRETNNALGWDKPQNRTAAVTAVNHALGTLHDNQSLCIRLANEGATRMQTRLKNGETIGPAFVHYLNSMTSEYGVDTFKLPDDNGNGDDDEEDDDNGNGNDDDDANDKVGRVSFRVGTYIPPSASSGMDAETLDGSGPWIEPPQNQRSLVLGTADLQKARDLIKKGSENLKLPAKKVPSCIIGSVLIWTAGQVAN